VTRKREKSVFSQTVRVSVRVGVRVGVRVRVRGRGLELGG